MTISTLQRIAAGAFVAGLAVSFHAAAQTYPAKPVRVIVPLAEGGTPDHVSRRPARGDGVQPPGFIRVAAVQMPSYPTKPVRVIVPFAPGGGSDITARQVSQKLAEQLGQQFVVDNRGGAGGLIGMEITAKSAPDGYTIMVMSGSFSATPALQQPAFDPINNIIPIAEVGYTPFVLSVHPSLPSKTAKELIALARSKPGDLAYATPGVGSLTHLATELMLNMAKIKMIPVPYKSTGAAMTDLLAGQCQLIVGSLLPTYPHFATGRLRPLAVTTAQRWYALPKVPTLAETLPGYEVELWFGVMTPKGTPRAVIGKLNGAVNKLLQEPEMKKNLAAQGMVPSGGTPEKFDKRIRGDYERWIRVVREAGIKVQ